MLLTWLLFLKFFSFFFFLTKDPLTHRLPLQLHQLHCVFAPTARRYKLALTVKWFRGVLFQRCDPKNIPPHICLINIRSVQSLVEQAAGHSSLLWPFNCHDRVRDMKGNWQGGVCSRSEEHWGWHPHLQSKAQVLQLKLACLTIIVFTWLYMEARCHD